MMLWGMCIVVVGLFANDVTSSPVLTQPEQVHLSYGGSAGEMVVTWVTMSPCTSNSTVEYGEGTLSLSVQGQVTPFKDGGSEQRTIYIHRATMTALTPDSRYVYHVGSTDGWSELFFFRAMQEGTQWVPRLGIYGDMGNYNARSLSRLQQEVARGHFDALIHIGDFAYNMDSENGRTGDAFMNQIQPLAAYVPYMTGVGNHEAAYNFSHYRARFSMPGGSGDSMYYSFNMGPVHFLIFSSEHYYSYDKAMVAQQYHWMEGDLQEANKPAARAARPWIVTMCHRAMYCSNSDDLQHCNNPQNIIRAGLPSTPSYSPEELLYKYGVDLNIVGHEHSYERTWPVYNNTVCNGSLSEPYTNPTAPVHIVAGSAGCSEGIEPFFSDPSSWSAFRSGDYGYSHMTVYNNTHLYLEQISDNQQGQTIDRMMLIKDKHGPHTCAN